MHSSLTWLLCAGQMRKMIIFGQMHKKFQVTIPETGIGQEWQRDTAVCRRLAGDSAGPAAGHNFSYLARPPCRAAAALSGPTEGPLPTAVPGEAAASVPERQ